jgi:hypothetical protein
MRNFILLAVLTTLSACTTVEPQKPTAFNPEFSLADLEYVVESLLHYLENPTVTDEFSAKSLIKENGGLFHKDINVILPDDSIIRLRITSKRRLLISGYESSSEPFLRIGKDKEDYDISVGPSGGVGEYAEFSISAKGAKVKDCGILIACP